MNDWLWESTVENAFYGGSLPTINQCSWETIYQTFKARLKAEDEENRPESVTVKWKDSLGKWHDLGDICQCPGGEACIYLLKDKICTHPSKKPSEPDECDHRDYGGTRYIDYRTSYEYCPKCGKKLK